MANVNWTNSDGLYIKMGQNEATVTNTGEYNTRGRDHEIETVITLTSLTTTAAILNDTVAIPVGARISKVEVINQTAATSGGSATLSVGLMDQDHTTTIGDAGLVSALALASFDVAGETVTLAPGVTSVGTLVGTTISNAGYITAKYATAAFTAGVVRIRIFYFVP